VLETAAEVSSVRPGERVMALLAGGGYAEEVCVDEGWSCRCPPSSPLRMGPRFRSGSSGPSYLFTLGGAGAGQDVLITPGPAASARRRSSSWAYRARVLATVGSAEKAEARRSARRPAHLLPREKFETVVRDETKGRGVDVILDPGGRPLPEPELAERGRGWPDRADRVPGWPGASIDLGLLLAKRIRLIGSTLRPLPLERKRAAVAAFRQQFLAGPGDGGHQADHRQDLSGI